MVEIKELSGNFSTSAQIGYEDINVAKNMGITTIICNRPDYEDQGQLTAEEVKGFADKLGLSFVHIPISGRGPTKEAVSLTKDAIDASDGPILAYCRSGTRSTILWAVAQAMVGGMTSQELIDTAAYAGHNLDGLRPTLDSLTR